MTLAQLLFLVAVLGCILIVYSQFVEMEHRRDLIRLVGAIAVFIYALTLINTILLLLSGGIALAALIEFIEIITGHHHHRQIDIKTDRPI